MRKRFYCVSSDTVVHYKQYMIIHFPPCTMGLFFIAIMQFGLLMTFNFVLLTV